MSFMLACVDAVRLRIVKGVCVVALVLFLFTDFRLNSVMGQAKRPASVFNSALEQIQSQTRIPILLPSKLPPVIRESAIKLAFGEVRTDGYFVSLYYEEVGSNASYAAGFGGSTPTFRLTELRNTKVAALSHNRVGAFRPVSCGGSCAPANLWWEQDGAMYNFQLKLRSDTPEKDQEKILVETANLSVIAPRK